MDKKIKLVTCQIFREPQVTASKSMCKIFKGEVDTHLPDTGQAKTDGQDNWQRSIVLK